MQIITAIINLFQSLTDVLENLDESDYSKKLIVLNNSSLGQHVRHIFEFGECIINHKQGQILCYDDRKRNLELENSLFLALEKFENLKNSLEKINLNFDLKVKHFLGDMGEITTSSNLEREFLFVLDHTIHHMAILRIGIDTELPWIDLPKDFGFTPSTVRYKQLTNY